MTDSESLGFNFSATLEMLRSKSPRNEADVNSNLLKSVLVHVLGYQEHSIDHEHQIGLQRPDFVCRNQDQILDLIVEGKDLGVNLDKRPSVSDSATRIPKIQLEDYLRKRSDSDSGVFGLLSNGYEWRVCQRVNEDIHWLSKGTANSETELRRILEPLLQRSEFVPRKKQLGTLGVQWLEQIQRFTKPYELLKSIQETTITKDLERVSDRVSKVSVQLPSSESSLFEDTANLAVMKSKGDDGIVSNLDIIDGLKENRLFTEHGLVAGLATAIVGEKDREICRACRVFVVENGVLHSSNSFDPDLPGTRVLSQLERLARWSFHGPQELIKTLDAQSVKKDFYDQLASWFKHTGTSINDLRHLIRVLFSWFLMKHGRIPEELFEKHEGVPIHTQLVHLFNKTLSIDEAEREISGALRQLAMFFEIVPFINGSLFDEDESTLRQSLPDEAYIASGEKPGLFTILKRYEWTLTEHDTLQSDTAIDPSTIGSVFERFVAVAMEVQVGKFAKQPQGTYYTPKDLTEEMVVDALAHTIASRISNVDYATGLNLVHPKRYDNESIPWSSIFDEATQKEVLHLLRSITILDPCTGSGEFIVTALNALRRVERRLLSHFGDHVYDDHIRILHALEKQLYAADIHPIAVQITRFRFYLTFVSSFTSDTELKPFPNLETRVLAADSLHTRISRERERSIGTILEGSEHFDEWMENRNQYIVAYRREEKLAVLERDRAIRERILSDLFDPPPEVIKWLNHDSLASDAVATKIGLVLMFGRSNWDIIIGNPPYEMIRETNKNTEVLANAKIYGYNLTKSKNLYTLFVELGLNLLSVSKSVLTLVIPNSVCFGEDTLQVRQACEELASSIYLRTYNNRPQPVFPPHPFIKGAKASNAGNSQRVTVMSIVVNGSAKQKKTNIYSSCYIGIPSTETKVDRQRVLEARPGYLQDSIGTWNTWTTAGSYELLLLLKAISEKVSQPLPNHYSGSSIKKIYFPGGPRYFLSCIPEKFLPKGYLVLRGRSTLDNFIWSDYDKFFWSRICLYNSRVFLAYWLMVGNAQTLNKGFFRKTSLPHLWTVDAAMLKQASSIGKKFFSVENREKCLVYEGKKPNYNFQQHAPDLVHEADCISLSGLGLDSYKSPLLEQIEKVRLSETWNFSPLRS